MLLRSAAIDAYIIMMVHYLVHAHLKDVLGHLQAESHAQEPVPATMCVESGQV